MRVGRAGKHKVARPMSWQAIQSVIEHSQTKGSERLLLLIIAYHADRDTFTAFPSENKLCIEAKMIERNLIYTLAKLRDSRELQIDFNAGRGRANLYTLLLPRKGQSSAPTVKDSTPARGQSGVGRGGNPTSETGQHIAPKHIEQSVEQSLSRSRKIAKSVNRPQPDANAATVKGSGRRKRAPDIPLPEPMRAINPDLLQSAQSVINDPANNPRGIQVNIAREHSRFINHAEQNERLCKGECGWRAAWRNWILNAIERGERGGSQAAQGETVAAVDEDAEFADLERQVDEQRRAQRAAQRQS